MKQRIYYFSNASTHSREPGSVYAKLVREEEEGTRPRESARARGCEHAGD